MPDDKPMATLESIAAQLTTVVAKVDTVSSRVDTLATRLDKMDARLDRVDARFDTVDARFDSVDARFDAMDAKIDTSAADTRAQLGVKIEAVEENVKRVYDAVIALQGHHEANDKAHAVFNNRLEDHDLRILALEHPNGPKA